MQTFVNTVKYYFYYWDSQFTGFSPAVRITTFFIILLAIVYISLLLNIFLIEYKWRNKKKRYKKIRNRYEEKMKEILFSPENLSIEHIKSELRIKTTSFKKWEKRHITNLLLAIKSNSDINLLNKDNYMRIIDIFSLINHWESYLRLNNLKKNKQALRKLECLDVHISGTILANKVQAFNHDLRKHVKSGYVRFAQYDVFKFLENDFDGEFNPLDEIRIHTSLKEQIKLKQLPLLIRWVNTAKNDTYKCFIIEEIGYFQQKESAPQLLELYESSKNNHIKAKIVETLGILKYTESESVLISHFDSNPEYVQANIIEALSLFATPASLEFLEKISKRISDDDLFIKIVQNIYKIDNRNATFQKLKKDTTSSFQKSVFASIERV